MELSGMHLLLVGLALFIIYRIASAIRRALGGKKLSGCLAIPQRSMI